MKKKSFFSILLLISIIVFSGCKKADNTAPSAPGLPTLTKDVYVAGFETSGTKRVAKVWKNGVATSLTNGSNDASAVSVYVSGTDVYVAGAEVPNFYAHAAKVWKNGVVSSLTNGVNSAVAHSIFVY